MTHTSERGQLAARLAKPFQANSRFIQPQGEMAQNYHSFVVPGDSTILFHAEVRVYGRSNIQVRPHTGREEPVLRFRSEALASAWLEGRYILGNAASALSYIPHEPLEDQRSLVAQLAHEREASKRLSALLQDRYADNAKLREERDAAVEGGWNRVKQVYQTRQHQENNRLRSQLGDMRKKLERLPMLEMFTRAVFRAGWPDEVGLRLGELLRAAGLEPEKPLESVDHEEGRL